jgi:hypothetical protein
MFAGLMMVAKEVMIMAIYQQGRAQGSGRRTRTARYGESRKLKRILKD